MIITLNGQKTEVADESLAELLKSNGITPERQGVAVALNESIVPRSSWDSVTLNDGDAVEVITAMQGG